MRKSLIRWGLCLLITAVVLTASARVSAKDQPGAVWNEQENKALALLNADRATGGLPSLRANAELGALARDYCQDMINRSFFSHYNPEGQSPYDRMRQRSIKFRRAGENLAINISVEEAESAFMGSPDHRANILNPGFSDVGIAVLSDDSGAVYVVQEFIGN